jgi:bifunctional non-homologous end joining protein LigD
VGTGFSDRARRDLLEDLGPLEVKSSPFEAPLPARETSHAHFVRPVLVGEVAYGEWTPAGRLRHPIWRGLRPDKKPKLVTVE